MRSLLSFLSPIAAVAFSAAAGPASAQYAAAPDHVRPAVQSVALAGAGTAPAIIRTVAIYTFSVSPGRGLPSQVTVADSAGRLVASFRPGLGAAARPMTVGVFDTDLVLEGETRAGTLTLVFYGQNDPDATAGFIGRWSLAGNQGQLVGSAAR
jgi:hypothetical protein